MSLIAALATSATNYAQTPYGGTPHPIPGVIQAEDFDDGGEGVTYHATSPGNAGGVYRQTDIDIYPTTDTSGGYDVDFLSGEWLRYTVEVAQSGAYRVDLRMFQVIGQISGNIQLLVDGASVTGPLPIPAYAHETQYPIWQGVTAEPVVLSAGRHILQVSMGAFETWEAPFPTGRGVLFNKLTISPAVLRPAVVLAGTGVPGFADGPANQAQFSMNITGLDVDQAGNVYVADAGNLRVRKVSPDGQVSTLAGNGTVGRQNGPGDQAQFLALDALTVDSSGNCYVAEQDVTNNVNRIRLITSQGVVSTFYEESTMEQPYFTAPQKIAGMALDTMGRMYFTTYGTNKELSFWQYATLVAIKDGSRSVLASSGRSGSGGILILSPITTGHSTNIYYLESTGSEYAAIKSLTPNGTANAIVLSSGGDYSSYTGLTATPDGAIYVGTLGGIKQVSSDASKRLINNGTSFVGVLASDYSGNLYGFQSNQLNKVLVNYSPVGLSLFTQGGGTVSANPPGAYLSNTVVQVTATPSAGLQFIGWQGDVTGTNAQISLTMNASKTLQAVFGAQVNATPTTGGTVTRNPDLAIYPYNTQVTLTAQPNIGFEFFKWSDDNTNKVRTSSVTTAVNVQAVFSALPQFTLNAQVLAGTGGTVTAIPSNATYYRDTLVTLYARPAAGYVFQTWLDGNLSDPRVITMASNTTVFAVFAPGQGTAPTITTSPKNVEVVAGDAVTFSVAATGSVPLEYQWSHDGTPLTGETGPTLTLPTVQGAAAGTYSVTVKNSVDSVSASATLSLISGVRPSITSYQRLDGQFQFTISGTAGQQYKIESTPDLSTWMTVTNHLTNILGTVSYSAALGSTNLFYRVSVAE